MHAKIIDKKIFRPFIFLLNYKSWDLKTYKFYRKNKKKFIIMDVQVLFICYKKMKKNNKFSKTFISRMSSQELLSVLAHECNKEL